MADEQENARRVTLYKASPTVPEEPRPSLLVRAVEPVPDSLEDPYEFHRDQARRLYDALCDTMPQGTLDHLEALLTLRKGGLLRIALDDGRVRHGRADQTA